jgi:hypothetical protein
MSEVIRDKKNLDIKAAYLSGEDLKLAALYCIKLIMTILFF